MSWRDQISLPNLAALRLADSSTLATLPVIALIRVFAHLNTAQSVARLASTCKYLDELARREGWRAFVRCRFKTLNLPHIMPGHSGQWMDLARQLTSQSRAWDRRAFSLVSFVPPARTPPRSARGRGPRGRRGGRRGRGGRWSAQTAAPHVLVDASSRFRTPHVEEETVVWGAGEDVVVRWRELKQMLPSRETWGTLEGTVAGFQSGADDITAVSILNTSTTASQMILVGRASGYLQLLSISPDDFGRSLAWFHPFPNDAGVTSVQQNEVQNLTTSDSGNTMAILTKNSLFFYPLTRTWPGANQEEVLVQPIEGINMRDVTNSQEFRMLREAKFLKNGDLALGMTHSPAPLRYFKRTPTGSVLTNAAKMQPSNRCTASYVYNDGHPQTLRALLPVPIVSPAGGNGTAILSSYDDGTVRLQDLRTSSAIDTIYQDHFEVTTPVGPLVAYGTERFIVGSARDPILKIFDFRWPKTYYYTDALPCSKDPLGPTPKPLTWTSPPRYSEREHCCHTSGRLCRLHALARTDFYRPNCSVYLPAISQATSPIYSLSKPSNMSPVVYVGLAGELVRMSLSQEADERERSFMKRTSKSDRCGYGYQEAVTSIVETSDGIALSDISKSQRLPVVYKQRGMLSGQFSRLDGTLT